jgi:hypothetical protein
VAFRHFDAKLYDAPKALRKKFLVCLEGYLREIVGYNVSEIDVFY